MVQFVLNKKKFVPYHKVSLNTRNGACSPCPSDYSSRLSSWVSVTCFGHFALDQLNLIWELTLKCKLKCYLNPWITHCALALVKGHREPHEAKKKSFDLGGNRTHDLRIRSTVTLPTELQGRTETLPRVVPCFPLLGLTPSGLFMGLSSTLIYTSELILCSTICVLSATRHNIQFDMIWLDRTPTE